MSKFITDFIHYTDLIKSDQNFAYTRYADGEVRLMRGESVDLNSQAYQVDRWSSPNYITKVGIDLLDTLKHTESNFHYAISGRNDSIKDYEFLAERILSKNLTFANLWINANYQKMKNFYQTLQKDIYLICNYRANPNNFPFRVIEIFPFPDDCISYFNEFEEDYLSQLLEYTSNVQNKTFFISAGPVSEILIHYMYISNPNNQYIDVGSSIDEYVHGRITRPYMNPVSIYANLESTF